MKKLFAFLKIQVQGLHGAAFLLATFSLLSQVLGVVRDRILAHSFGASTSLDVYYAAFRIPDFLFISIASLVSMFVIIPILTEHIDQSRDEARRFLSGVTSAFSLGIIICSGVIFVCIPPIIRILYPDLVNTAPELISITRILLLSPILLGISNILASVTQITRQFFVYGLSPILYNLGIIAGIIWFYPIMGLSGLAWGVVLGALLHLIIQFPVLLHEQLMPRFTWSICWSEIRSIIIVSLPRTITLALNHAVLLVLIAFASRMSEGSITVFTFAQNIMFAPLSIIGVSYSVAAFPLLSRLFTKGDQETFVAHIFVALRHIIFWSLPITALCIVLRAQIVRTLLGSGVFDWSDTRLTAAALALFVISLVANALVLLFVRAYYAAGKTKQPLYINLVGSTVSILSAYLFYQWFSSVPIFRYTIETLFRVSDVPGTDVLVLPLAYSFGMIINVFLFVSVFRKHFGTSFPNGLHKSFWHVLSASILGGATAYGILNMSDHLFSSETLLGVFAHGALAGFVGISVVIIVLAFLKNEELTELLGTFHKKFWNTPRAVFPDSESI